MSPGNTKIQHTYWPAPPALDLAPSTFVVRCLKELPETQVGFAADFGAGYGRHALLLAHMGYTVLALDLDSRALRTLKAVASRPRHRQARGQIIPVMADVGFKLPLRPARLDLVLAVHCSVHRHFPAIEGALAPGGLFIYETFGGQGRNWMDLPKTGQLRASLRSKFEILNLSERPVGPGGEGRVAAKLLAQKR